MRNFSFFHLKKKYKVSNFRSNTSDDETLLEAMFSSGRTNKVLIIPN